MICENCHQEIEYESEHKECRDDGIHIDFICSPKILRSKTAKRGLPSANGCRDANASSNQALISSGVVETKAGLAAAVKDLLPYIAKTAAEWKMEAMRQDGSHKRTYAERYYNQLTYLRLKLQKALAADSAPPCGERARLDNAEVRDPAT